MERKMRRLFFFKTVTALALAFTMLMGVSLTWAEPWKFGVMSDTQWKANLDGENPGTVAVGIINQLNTQFIMHDVEFVVQVGDLVDVETDGLNGAPSVRTMPVRAAAAQALYEAGIGFYPLRGNHEASATAATEFQTLYPQTIGMGDHVFEATNFNSPTGIHPNYDGLTYSFDYGNARFVLLDTFSIPNIACNLIESQQPWISSTLATRPAGTHVFVFSHKGLMTENHKDILFTYPGDSSGAGAKCNGSSTSSTPAVKPDEQNVFMSSLFDNGVRYYFNGHDHMHNRAIVTSPDGSSQVQNITTSSNSYKFYIPIDPSADEQYNLPAFGFLRETPIAQELFTVGYYIVTVDGPRVTVDHYASDNGCGGDCDLTATPVLSFSKRETFGYSLNGNEFVVPQGEPYAAVQDSFNGTNAKILNGTNDSVATVYDGRATTKAVNTGWTPKTSRDTVSNILTLWGMADLGSDQTDTYTLSMSYEKLLPIQFGKGLLGIATKDENGDWVNAVDMNFGGTKKFILGSWKPEYGLGTYGIDLKKKTAWAVINYNGDFAVAGFRHFDTFDGAKP
jgi:hypothetical protein